MTSPASDVIAKRRYSKHRKNKKKRNKEPLYNVIPHAKISKRLTSGFCFKGAVVTSPHSRNSKGGGLTKARKSSNDHDLQCLLKAAKTKVNVINHSQSSSTDGLSSTEEIDSEFNQIERGSDDRHDKHHSFKRKPPKQPAFFKEIHAETETFPDNRRRREEQDFEEAEQVEMVPMVKQDSSDHLYKGRHVPTNDQYSVDLNSSRENSITHSKTKPHISSYQKFAVGVGEALVIEKKKQFPNLGLSKQIKQELNNMYQNRKNVTELSKKVPSPCLQMPEGKHYENCESKSKCQLASPTSIQQGYHNEMEKKTFKERTVEAWVKAIPEASIDNPEKLDKHQDANSKHSRSKEQFERDFLKNVKQDHPALKHSNPFVSKKESSPLWIMDGVKSPSFSPFLIKEKNAVLGLPFKQNEVQESHRNKTNHMKLNFKFVLEKGQGYQNSTGVAQQSQMVWSKGKTNILQRKLSDTICPSPLFTFDPPGYKQTWVAMKNDSGSTDRKHLAPCIESAWSHFPKMLKKDEREESHYKGFHDKKEITLMYNQSKSNIQEYDNPIANERSLINPKPESPAYIKFSPRKMF